MTPGAQRVSETDDAPDLVRRGRGGDPREVGHPEARERHQRIEPRLGGELLAHPPPRLVQRGAVCERFGHRPRMARRIIDERVEPAEKRRGGAGDVARPGADRGPLGLDPLALQAAHPEVLLDLVPPAPGGMLRAEPAEIPPCEGAVQPFEQQRRVPRLAVNPSVWLVKFRLLHYATVVHDGATRLPSIWPP
jgi:hypothetical protein